MVIRLSDGEELRLLGDASSEARVPHIELD
jgi:hypothetical protein